MTRLPPLPPREPSGHKGTFGTVCVLGGQAAPPNVMIGGPAFTAMAALRAGAGLAVLAVPAPIMSSALVIAPSATGLALPVTEGDHVVVPSAIAALLDQHLPKDRPQQQILVRLLSTVAIPMVIDADGLNALAAVPGFQGDFRGAAVLTPHPGEFRRLAANLGIDADPVDPGSRTDAAEQLARRLGCVVVLKGAGTVVTDGIRTNVNETGNVVLATAGTGDVLTGVIASIVAQVSRGGGDPDLFDCARLGVHLHGLAADLWAAERGFTGMTAADLIDRNSRSSCGCSRPSPSRW